MLPLTTATLDLGHYGSVTQHRDWSAQVRRLCEHCGGGPSVGCPAVTSVGSHRDCTGKLNDPGWRWPRLTRARGRRSLEPTPTAGQVRRESRAPAATCDTGGRSTRGCYRTAHSG